MPEKQRWWSDKGTWILLGLFILQLLLSFRPGNLAWDGVYYYAYARSIVIDGDLHLKNDLQLAYDVTPAYDFAAAGLEDVQTPTGRVDSPFAIGTGLLWIPWFALVYGLTRLAAPLGIGPAAPTGFEWPFLWTMATVTAVYGWIAILVGYRLIRQWISRWAAVFAAAVLMFVTPLWYYGLHEPFYAHPASAMTVALFVATWWHTTQKHALSDDDALKLGALCGLAALVRWQNLAYMVLPLLTALGAGWCAWRANERQKLRTSTRYLLVSGLAALVVFSPQIAVWTLFYGRPWVIPQGADFVDLRIPWLPQVLLSPFHGLVPWMPVVVPALIGLVLLGRRRSRAALPLLIAFSLQIIINSSIRQWYGGGGYGARRFSSALIILLIGYAALLSRRRPRWIRIGAVALGGFLMLHQWLILRYGFAERIGGYAIDLDPSYEWHADSPATFVRQLIGYLPRVTHSPIRSIILPGSPLDTAAPLAMARQLVLLAAVTGTLALLRWGWRHVRTHLTPTRIAIGATILIFAFDTWVLTWA
jgi:hypothetical protein